MMYGGTPVTREIVIWAYRMLLGREPESEFVIGACLRLPNVDVLRTNIISSDEFKRFHFAAGFRTSDAEKIVRCDIRNDLVLYVDLADQYVSLGCLMDDYESIETEFIEKNLKDGDVFIDIGANIGWHTINAAHKCGATGHVYAFEPRNQSRRSLIRSVVDNGYSDRVTVFDCGIGRRNELVTLKWATRGANPGAATIDPIVPDKGHTAQVINLMPLDSLNFDKVTLIKIDIEGAELLAIKGARATILRHKPLIISEIIAGQLHRVSGGTEEEYIELMGDLGYTCHLLDQDGVGEIATQENIFMNSSIVNVVFIPN